NIGVVLFLMALTLVQGARLALGRRAGHTATQLTSMLDGSREGSLLVLVMLVGLGRALRALWTRSSPAAAVGWIAAALACVLFVEGWLYPARLNAQMPILAFAEAMRRGSRKACRSSPSRTATSRSTSTSITPCAR